jgi:hypothetical protein
VGNVINRVFDSSGPDGKVRGTPQQIIEKYNQLARDAQLANDRVATENFQQHAEHYTRLLAEAQRDMDQRREQQERDNRERQAQRDRDRGPRDDDDNDVGSDVLGGDYDGDEQPIVDSMPMIGEDYQPALRRRVEQPKENAADTTQDSQPEDKPKPRKPRGAPRRKKADAPEGQAEAPSSPEAAE